MASEMRREGEGELDDIRETATDRLIPCNLKQPRNKMHLNGKDHYQVAFKVNCPP